MTEGASTETPEQRAEREAAEQLTRNLKDPMWRLSNLYWILIKGEDGDEDTAIKFKPNRAQRRFINRLWYRNLILKARQLGFTTLICLVWLDHALFNANQRCGIIAQDKEAAEAIFVDKVVFAYDNLPPTLKANMPIVKKTATQIKFGHNNSSVRVATSMRSGTIHRLLVSEYGKICAKAPEKAKEVMTGSLPAVPLHGIAVIESTAEGQEGDFYDKVQTALGLQNEGVELTPKQYRLHFYPWHGNPEYSMPVGSTVITPEDHKYFDEMEQLIGKSLSLEQRAWYVATREADFSGSDQKMWQEYPSTPEEAFQRSTEGNWYVKEMAAVRTSGRILDIPVLNVPVNTFWDIGNSDGCAIWMHQQVGMEHRFIDYYEDHGQTLKTYVKALQDRGYLWGKHYLPHDAEHERLSDSNKSVEEMLIDLGLKNTEIVPRIDDLTTGIQMMRDAFPACFFDRTRTAEGIKRLDNYKKRWDNQQGRFLDAPVKNDGNSEGADAIRQFAQVLSAGPIGVQGGGAWRRKDKGWKRT